MLACSLRRTTVSLVDSISQAQKTPRRPESPYPTRLVIRNVNRRINPQFRGSPAPNKVKLEGSGTGSLLSVKGVPDLKTTELPGSLNGNKGAFKVDTPIPITDSVDARLSATAGITAPAKPTDYPRWYQCIER